MSVVLDNLHGQNLDRAHMITAFYFAGIGAGHRMRLMFEKQGEVRGPATARALRHSLGLHRRDPFCAGWDMGWRLELGRADDAANQGPDAGDRG